MFEVKANRNKNTTPYCAAVIHPISGETITKSKKLAADPATQAVWTTAFGKEWGNLTQEDNKTRTKGMDSLIILNHEEIRNKYKKLAADPATQAVWTTAFGKEWGNLTQKDNKTRTKGTDSLIVLNHEEIRKIPTYRTVTYANIVVD